VYPTPTRRNIWMKLEVLSPEYLGDIYMFIKQGVLNNQEQTDKDYLFEMNPNFENPLFHNMQLWITPNLY
jgi:hypothetical protein